MYQLNKRQTLTLLNSGKLTFLYKTLHCSVLITIYRDQISNNSVIRVPIRSKNKSYRLMVTIPYLSNQLVP
jgi:hypothetical protein